jgi:hypothetical protein
MLSVMRMKKPGGSLFFSIEFVKISDGAITPLAKCTLTSYDWRKRTITLHTPDRDRPRTIRTCSIIKFNQLEVLL